MLFKFRIILTVAFAVFSCNAHAAEVQQVESSGLKALLIEETSVPAFNLRVSFRHSGHGWQKPEKQGLAYLVSTLMNEGAGSLDSRAFQKEMEKNAIRPYGTADTDMFSISLQSLSEKHEKAMELMLLSITEPRFDEEAIGRMRDSILNEIARLEGRPNYVTARAWWAAAFPNHPYGREARGTVQTLKGITQNDIKRFAKERFAKDTIMIAAAGDISPEQLKAFMDKLAAALPASAAPIDDVAKVEPLLAPEPPRISREVPQSVVMFGLPGIARKDPRFYTAFVLNHILGGDELSSRLMDTLREKKGLIYSVSTDLINMEKASLFTGMLASSNETVDEAIKVMREQIKLIGEKGVTAKELEDAKAFLTGSFPLNMDSNDQLTSYLMSIQLYDLGLDFFRTRNDQVNAVTLEGINKLAKDMFADKEPLIVVTGKNVPAAQKPGSPAP